MRKVLAHLGRQSVPIVIVDEFDRLEAHPRRAFADLIKTLSDHDVEATVVLVGVADSIDGLLQDHESISRALVQVHMPRMQPIEIREIVVGGAKKLGMTIDAEAVSKTTAIAQGLPHYAHLLALHALRAAIEEQTLHVTERHIREAVGRAAQDTHHSIQKAYHEAIRSAHEKPFRRCPPRLCARGNRRARVFRRTGCPLRLREITGKNYEIANFAQHLSEFCSEKRGRILQVTGQKRLLRYRFREALMQPFVIMQGEITGRLPQQALCAEYPEAKLGLGLVPPAEADRQ